jgi:hypothetical protein
MYCAFLDWCRNHPELPHYEFPENKDAWFERIEYFFPTFSQKLQGHRERIAQIEEYKTIYNGRIIAENTGLEGKALGEFMAGFREKHGGKEELMKKVLDGGQEWVTMQVKEHLTEHKLQSCSL